MKLCLCLAIVLSLNTALLAAAPNTKAFEGTWKPIKAELSGQTMPDIVLKATSLKLDGSTYEVTVVGEPDVDKGTYTIDASTKPKSMVITGTSGPNRGKVFSAIYELKGKMLRVCYDLSGAKRPTDFKTLPGTELYLVTYKRQKK